MSLEKKNQYYTQLNAKEDEVDFQYLETNSSRLKSVQHYSIVNEFIFQICISGIRRIQYQVEVQKSKT